MCPFQKLNETTVRFRCPYICRFFLVIIRLKDIQIWTRKCYFWLNSNGMLWFRWRKTWWCKLKSKILTNSEQGAQLMSINCFSNNKINPRAWPDLDTAITTHLYRDLSNVEKRTDKAIKIYRMRFKKRSTGSRCSTITHLSTPMAANYYCLSMNSNNVK